MRSFDEEFPSLKDKCVGIETNPTTAVAVPTYTKSGALFKHHDVVTLTLDKQRVREVLERHARRPRAECQSIHHQDANRYHRE